MQITNHCRKIRRLEVIAIYKYAKRLEAEECIIHSDGTISLYCKDGCICEHYSPGARELRNDK